MTDTTVGRVRNEATVPPVPEELLAPLLDVAAEILVGLDTLPDGLELAPDEVLIAPSPTDLRRAIEADAGFRRRVCGAYLDGDDDAVRLVDGWRVDAALDQVTIAFEDGALSLLVSALYAGRPTGWGYGLGVACALHAGAGSGGAAEPAGGPATDHEVRAALELAEQAEDAARQAAAARDAAEAERDALVVRLAAAEAAGRVADEARARAERAEIARAEADARAVELAGEVGSLERRLADAESAREVAVERARAAEVEAAETARGRAPAPERIALADAASLARRLSARLDELTAPDIAPTRPARAVDPEPEPSVTPTADRIAERRGPEPSGPRPAARIPVGLRPDSPEGIDALLRTPRLVVVVDATAASTRLWPEEAVAERRTRIVGALRAVHARYRCDLDAVFSADGPEPPGRIGRPGVRAVFSAPGEQVAVTMARQIAGLPASVPVLAVSSEPGLAGEAVRHGATVVTVEAFRAALGA